MKTLGIRCLKSVCLALAVILLPGCGESETSQMRRAQSLLHAHNEKMKGLYKDLEACKKVTDITMKGLESKDLGAGDANMLLLAVNAKLSDVAKAISEEQDLIKKELQAAKISDKVANEAYTVWASQFEASLGPLTPSE